MANQEKELQKFVTKPSYREKVISRVHREQDWEYSRRIGRLRSEKDNIISKRQKEIKKITKNRWENVVDDKLLVNYTETKVKINGIEFLFSDIKGAEPNVQGTYRVVTESEGKSKKHGSLGGAIVGNMFAGGFGAIVGGTALGKTTVSGTTTQDQIPMYNHIGVLVNLNGITTEIVLLSKQVEQTDSDCQKALKKAQDILTKLASISTIPVVTNPLKVEDEPSVKAYDQEIVNKDKEIQFAINDRPTYELPAMYRTYEQREMSDREYLEYLAREDENRAGAKEKAVELMSIPEEIVVSSEPIVEAENNSEPIVEAENNENVPIEVSKQTKASGASVVKKVFSVIADVFGWIFSVVTSFFIIASAIEGDVTSIILLIIATVTINPLPYKFIKLKAPFLHRWMFVITYVALFITAMVFYGLALDKNAEQDPPEEMVSIQVVEDVVYDLFECEEII